MGIEEVVNKSEGNSYRDPFTITSHALNALTSILRGNTNSVYFTHYTTK